MTEVLDKDDRTDMMARKYLSHNTDPMWGVSTSDQWIPCTKVQQSGALMFPLLLA